MAYPVEYILVGMITRILFYNNIKIRVVTTIQALKMSTRDFYWSKGGRCDRLTTLVVPNVNKIRGLNLPGTPWATLACCGRPLSLPLQQYRQCTYKHNIEARYRNHCCSGKAISITYSECVSVTLVNPACNAPAPCYIAICDLRDPTIRFHVTHKRQDFRKNIFIEYETYVLVFYITIFFKHFSL